MNDSTDREAEIFVAARRLPAAQRSGYLGQACAVDAALRRRIDDLLQEDATAGGLLEGLPPERGEPSSQQPEAPPGPGGTMRMAFAPSEKSGDRIGRYKLLQEIGQGGCGVVYMAEQQEPVRRRVALKVIKLGMDTKQVIARFEAERQALALMDHPHIAKVLEAGATETGRPFFVMELVKGIPITRYCDENHLDTKTRLGLFVQICQAIQHAHQKGIIHRDIKPSNILVADHDGVPVPKIIDFGIAKATTDQPLTDKTLFTAFEQFIGTPAYMSPEQAKLSGLDVDTRSDIYSLGVLLYELLTGKTPFDAQRFSKAGLDEVRRIIREEEPPRPSTRLRTLTAAEQTTVARHRQCEPPKLLHLLGGDMDWIVLKSLEKDRTRRYETANGLALDVQRYLADETVVARPPSSAYRFQKLVRRNKLAFGAAGAVACALLLGIIATTWQAVRATHAKREALAAEQEQARLRIAAEEEAARSKKIAQASMLLARGDNGGAEQILNAMPLQAEMVGLFAKLGDDYARDANWQHAITNFAKVAELDPSNPPSTALAVLDFQTGDTEGYEHWRGEVFRQFGTTTNVWEASNFPRVCLLAPPAAAEAKTFGNVMDFLMANSGSLALVRRPRVNQLKGLWEYRQSHFAEAGEWLQKSAASWTYPGIYWNLQVQTWMLLAMSEYQLKQTDDARTALVKGLQMADEKMIKPGNDLGPDWDDWLMAHFLMREAAGMMPEVIASNPAFAEVVAEKPGWQMALDRAGLKFDTSLQSDGPWALWLGNQPVSDLSVLRGAPIRSLFLQNTAVSDLTPLRGMPLAKLILAGTQVRDLSPLSGMALVSLDLSGIPVSDISPLRGMPLTDLSLASCTSLTNLEPLAGMTTLQTLLLPPNATNIEFLRGLTNLTRLGFKNDPNKTAAEFWADYDKNRNDSNAGPSR